MSDLKLLLINTGLYTFAYLFYRYRNKRHNSGSFVLLLFMIGSLSAYMFYKTDTILNQSHIAPLKLEPFIYLFVTLMLFLYPILNWKSDLISTIYSPPISRLRIFVISVLVMQLILVLVFIPEAIKSLLNSSLDSLRKQAYDGSESQKWYRQIGIINQIDLIYMGITHATVIVASFCNVFINQIKIFKKNNRNYLRLFLLLSLIIPILKSLIEAGRGSMIMFILFVGFVYLMFYNFINKGIRKKLLKFSLIFIFPFLSFFWAVSVARFGNLAFDFVFKYGGESFINFNNMMYYDLKSTIDFNIYFPLIDRIINNNTDIISTNEKWNLIELQSGVRGQFFYSIVGGFCYVLGKSGTMVLSIGWAIFFSLFVRQKKSVNLPQLILIGVLGYTLISGLFLFSLQGITGNLRIMLTVLLYIYFTKIETS